jgi:hypothetical protein
VALQNFPVFQFWANLTFMPHFYYIRLNHEGISARTWLIPNIEFVKLLYAEATTHKNLCLNAFLTLKFMVKVQDIKLTPNVFLQIGWILKSCFLLILNLLIVQSKSGHRSVLNEIGFLNNTVF